MCGVAPADLHHKLTRARGGKLLDEVGETYHQMYLCRKHHSWAHAHAEAWGAGLMVDGYVSHGSMGEIVYQGPDDYLRSKYGQDAHDGSDDPPAV